MEEYKDKIASKNIKVLVIMTHDENGNLVPAENHHRWGYNSLLEPIWIVEKGKYVQGRKSHPWVSGYIRDKVKMWSHPLDRKNKFEISSKNGPFLGEYRNDVYPYWVTIKKGMPYRVSKNGDVILCEYEIGKPYEFPKLFFNLEKGDKIWYCRYITDTGLVVPPKELTIDEIHKFLNVGRYLDHIEIRTDNNTHSFDAYVDSYTRDLMGDYKFYALDRKDIVESLSDVINKKIQTGQKEIEKIESKIKELENVIQAVAE